MVKKSKKIYLDVCTLCRPFDDQAMMRVRLETDAYYLILQAVQNKKYALIVSPVHFLEIDAIDDVEERYEVAALLKKFGVQPSWNSAKTRQRAEELYQMSFGAADAAHVAFAEAGADFFITCDDKLLKKCRRIDTTVKIASPVNFIIEEDLK
jgi:predicted nucleic acid-binding protein